MSSAAQNGSSKAGEFRRSAERGFPEALSITPIRVLVVDDLSTNQKVLRHVVEKCGPVRVETCGSGEEATRLCRERPFDLVLMDLHMPEMTGFEAGAEILAARNGPFTPGGCPDGRRDPAGLREDGGDRI